MDTLEKTFKMVALCNPKEIDIVKEVLLFENVFENDQVDKDNVSLVNSDVFEPQTKYVNFKAYCLLIMQ